MSSCSFRTSILLVAEKDFQLLFGGCLEMGIDICLFGNKHHI
eukprot:UN07020